MIIADIKDGYRRNHHGIELAMQRLQSANLKDYDECKKILILNLNWQIEYLNKIKKEMEENEKSS